MRAVSRESAHAAALTVVLATRFGLPVSTTHSLLGGLLGAGIAFAGLWLTLDAGQFEKIEVNDKSGAIRLGFAPATQFTKQARLRVEQPAKLSAVGAFRPKGELKIEREAYVVHLSSTPTWIELTEK